jgi:hypothetical protein
MRAQDTADSGPTNLSGPQTKLVRAVVRLRRGGVDHGLLEQAPYLWGSCSRGWDWSASRRAARVAAPSLGKARWR